MTSWTYVEDIEESHAPPTKPLLRLSVIGNGRLLSVMTMDPDVRKIARAALNETQEQER